MWRESVRIAGARRADVVVGDKVGVLGSDHQLGGPVLTEVRAQNVGDLGLPRMCLCA